MTHSIARQSRSHFRGAPWAALALAAALVACNELPKQRGQKVATTSNAALEKKNPIDVVVAPVVDASTIKSRTEVPLADLREAFQKGLVRRRYSPLALDYVDKKVVEAAYPIGALKEEAVLQVTIESWDATLLDTRGALITRVRARLLDAVDPGRAQLWQGTIDHRFDFEGQRDKFNSRAAFTDYICDRIAEEVLAALPPRAGAGG